MLILIDYHLDSQQDEKFYENITNVITNFLDINDDAELSILITDDAHIAELNAQYRGIPAPTDVLSFPMEDDYMLGDIVISLETAARQADEAGIPLERELAFLFIHGFLHLSGYDHEDESGGESADAEEMYNLQEEILRAWVEKYE